MLRRLFGLESKKEKSFRLQLGDKENEIARLRNKEKNLPYFGWKYEDDDR